MNSQQIRKLPGAKKEFPFVKAKIDNGKPVKLANKPAVRNPDEIQFVPVQSAKADVAPLVTKVGFGYQGFGETSITAAIRKHEIIRPSAEPRDKKIHPSDWNFSSKPELSSVKSVMKDLKPKPFKARPVPRSHYDKPFPPVSSSKKVTTTAVEVQPTVPENTDSSVHPGLASRMWHSMIDPILHSKKPELDEKLDAGHDMDEKPDEKQSDVQQEVVEDPQVPETNTSEIPVNVEGETSFTSPEAVEDQPIAETVESLPIPDNVEIPSNPEAVLDPTREDVEVIPSLSQEVESRLETAAPGTQKMKRRHDKRRRHSDGHLTKKEPEMPEEPVRPGLLRRAVVGIGSTAWSAGKSVLSGVGSVVGLGRTKTPDSIPDEPAAVKDQKKHRNHKKKTHHKRSAGKDQ